MAIKKIFCLGLVFLSSMLLLPLCTLNKTAKSITASGQALNITDAQNIDTDTFRIYNSETEKITEMSAKDYIFGVVAAEMPASYETEALKAQAVAAYTFACFRRLKNKNKEYDLTTDFSKDQAYITREAAAERWGSNSDSYTKKIENAVNTVSGYMISYNGSPVLSVYHAISNGKTESAKNVWGQDYPYLTAVNSVGDKLSANYISTVEISLEEFREKLKDTLKLSGEAKNYIGKITRTDSGTVLKICICDKELTGSEIRNAFALHSASFDLEFKNEAFHFTVYGYGHGVGMSQFGADYLAKQGADFKEILTTYYKGCKVEKISQQ